MYICNMYKYIRISTHIRARAYTTHTHTHTSIEVLINNYTCLYRFIDLQTLLFLILRQALYYLY